MPLAIPRLDQLREIRAILQHRPVTMILGPRQIGKTTLARQLAAEYEGRTTTFDLENPEHLARLENPMLALRPLRGLVVIDEVQHLPGLFPVLRVLADRPRRPARFLLLGSASFDLVRNGSETLAGRIGFHEVPGFSMGDVGVQNLDRLWLRGGFPRSYLAPTGTESSRWRRDFITTFLQRDLPAFGGAMTPPAMGRFWNMLAHWHGQVWNGSEFGRSFGISHTAVRKYLDLLTGTFMVRQLLPWYENLGKRQVKSPKIYLGDSGILHALLGIDTEDALLGHPKVGASWEGFALAQVIRALGARDEECFFWATHAGAELDLLVVRGSRRIGFEFKRTDGPKVTASMRSAWQDLRLDRLDVIHAGEDTFPLDTHIRAVAARSIPSQIKPLR